MLRLLLPLFWPWTFFVFFFFLLKAKALCPRNRKLLQKTWKKIKYKKEKKLLCLNGPINGLLSLTTTGVLWYTIQRLSQRIKILQTTTWCFLLLFIGFIDRDIYSIPSSSSSWIQLLAAKSEPPRKGPLFSTKAEIVCTQICCFLENRQKGSYLSSSLCVGVCEFVWPVTRLRRAPREILIRLRHGQCLVSVQWLFLSLLSWRRSSTKLER